MTDVIYMFSRSNSIVLLICPCFITLTFVVTAILHLFELGKSKTRVKKETKAIPFFKKLSLKGYVDRCEHHRKLAARIRSFYIVYQFVVVVGLAVFLISSFITALAQVANCFGIVKFLTMDCPFIIFSIVNTKYNKKHGGVIWKWETE